MNSSWISLVALVLLAGVSFAAAGDGVEAPEGGFVSEEHEVLYKNHQLIIGEAEATAKVDSATALKNFGLALNRRMAELSQHAQPARIRELQAIAKQWQGGEIDGEVPEELAGVVGGYRNTQRGVVAHGLNQRLASIDRLIRGIDKLADALEEEKQRALREEAQALLGKRGGRQKFGQLEVSTFHWAHGEPRFVRMKREGDELLSIAHFGGTFAGGGESQFLGHWGAAGELGLLGHAMQGDIASTALALRDPRLRMSDAQVSMVGIDHKQRHKKLIHQSKGFCYFGGIWGHWGELARAEVRLDAEDGFYYLSGRWPVDAHAYAVVVEYPEGKMPNFDRSISEWRRGDPVRDPIDAKDGICLMTGASGAILGGGEFVFVRIGSDGRWRVGGRSDKLNTGVKAVVLKFKE